MEDNNPNLNPSADELKGGEGTPGQVDNPGEKTDPQEKTFTQEEVNKMITERLARNEAKYEKRFAELTEAQKLQSMTEEERKNAEQEKFLAEYEELKAKNARYEMGRVATSLLSEHKVPVTEQILDLVIGTDAETTKTNIEAFTKLVNETASKMVTDQLRGKTPARANGVAAKTMDEIAQIKNPEERYKELEKIQQTQ